MFATEGVQMYDESSANIGRKRPLKTKKSGGFQPITVSFASFSLVLSFFIYFRSFSVLPNVTAPFSFIKVFSYTRGIPHMFRDGQ